ncbi:CPP1-like family protein [Kovacikia minuta CCNUW1]|uniref:CPP1-like family protein n=1 Tax=Kovacikia minuta TaxID=2931930 RepID=UPI001CCA2AE7|nr:CPP1-like family protein [Kovacikia minuta]UBF26563.1 CPP1-like family protein [Kovacikia minuta CCNUW1]
MSSQNPYEQLGVTEASSFDEIQDARNRLFAEYEGDRKQQELVEAAYDAVLMDRLRLRQEGKIKVPDRIRFPEKTVKPPPSPSPAPTASNSTWLQRLVDTPSQKDILLPAGVMTALTAGVFLIPSPSEVAQQQLLQFLLVLGVGLSFYFLFRKERKLGRSVLLALAGLIVGLSLGYMVSYLLKAQLLGIGLPPEALAAAATFLVLWLVSSFLR